MFLYFMTYTLDLFNVRDLITFILRYIYLLGGKHTSPPKKKKKKKKKTNGILKTSQY